MGYHIRDFATTPPMGWNSWDCFSVTVTENEVKQNAEFISENLKELGWEYVVVDLGWYAPGVDHESYKGENILQLIDEYGRLIPDPEKFPSSAGGKGFKPLADYIHSLGLKFGIHIMRGIPVQAVEERTPVKGTELKADQISYKREKCPWYNSLHTLDFSKAGAQEYYNSLFELYAEWGVDYIKADDLNSWHEVNNSDGSPTGSGSPYRIDDVEGIARSIQNSGRPMVLSISPGGPETTIVNHLRKHTNLWRISADFWDHWGSLKKQMQRCAVWAPFVTEGHWPDADMLPLGDLPRGESGGQNRTTNFTCDEQYTVMSLWSIFRSPLMFGGNLPNCDEFTLDLLTNEEVIYVNQNCKNSQQVFVDDDLVIWLADDTNSSDKFMTIFNISESNRAFDIDFSDFGFTNRVIARDLWGKQDLGEFEKIFSCKINKHGSKFLQLNSK